LLDFILILVYNINFIVWKNMDKIFKYVSIGITIFCAVMIGWHHNDPEVSAWIIGFTGWFNHALDMFIKDKSNEQV
jgi:hypothetical protein